nr:uncharacterized protein LOC115255977 [Aedes albopictus]
MIKESQTEPVKIMLLELLVLYLCFRSSNSAYVSVQSPYVNSAGVNYVGGHAQYHSGYLTSAARYPNQVQAVQLVGSPSYQSYPSYYPYNIQSPAVSFAPHPFQTYGHAAVGPVVYGGVQRPSVVAYAPQPFYPVATPHQGPAVHAVHVPAAPVVPVHVPVAPVKPVTTVTNTETPLPVIKSRKYKVRRPAIQNQFYDIEERVIIRPVGSALVELEQPASRTETKVTSHTVQTQPNRGSGGQGRAVFTGTTTVTQKPQIIHTVYQQTPVQHTPVVAPHPVIIHASSAGHVVPQPAIHHVQAPVPVYVKSRVDIEDQNQSQSSVSERQQTQSRRGQINEITATSPRVIIANGLSADQARSNQDQFIRLLSERDSISEVGYGPNTDTSSSLINTYVRSRVLSATPAPQGAKETSRTVNIRRIIVSRPIETEQEVEVREHTFSAHPTTHQVTSSSEQVPVYTTIKPPAFASDDAK